MKYIGENAIKKLISLIKGDLATKQPTITASGLLKGDGAGTITAADTQEATLVDVPNGLLKGDGTTISAAVAETDYMVPPAGGTTGQVLKKTETGTEWADTQFKPAGKSYLTFSSPNSFTLKVNDATKHWDGTLEYFASNKTWTVWDGTTALSSVDNDGEYVLYLRGTGNTVITGNNSNSNWVLTGSNIKCIGNIENLLDYATVESGAHPTLANYCYYSMFSGCTSLTQAPDLPATTLASNCYRSMFQSCTALIKAPALPATTLANYCYYSMFSGCTSLTQAPDLPTTTLANYCYYSMFSGCTSLKLSTTKTDEYTQEYRIPSSGTGTTATNALTDMFTSTGGTFTGTPSINTTYYLSSDNMVVYDTEVATLREYVGSVAAPAGYGLGAKTARLITDGNDALVGGWFYWGNIDTNLPFTYGHLRVDPRLLGQTSGKQTLMQTAYSDSYPGCVAQRKLADGVWKPWEWVNPPMAVGVEYRTTERHLGNPVYKKMDSDGVIWWSTDQSTWKREAERVGAAPSTHASQHATGGSDPITPASIGAAPAGYGSFGETLTDALVLDDEDGALLRNKLIEIAQSMKAPNTKRIFFHAAPFVESYWNFGIVSSFVNETGKLRVILDAYMTNGHVWKMMYKEGDATEWTEPEFPNPILQVGKEYRTTERYQNKAVYKKLDTDGVIKWRLDGETTWHTDKPISKSVTLSASGWNSSAKTQTVTVSGVLADETKQLITPTPALASQTAYYDAGILCTGQAANKLTFTAKKIPTASLTVYVTIQEVSA